MSSEAPSRRRDKKRGGGLAPVRPEPVETDAIKKTLVINAWAVAPRPVQAPVRRALCPVLRLSRVAA